MLMANIFGSRPKDGGSNPSGLIGEGRIIIIIRSGGPREMLV